MQKISPGDGAIVFEPVEQGVPFGGGVRIGLVVLGFPVLAHVPVRERVGCEDAISHRLFIDQAKYRNDMSACLALQGR